jgi:hypothetical protein
MERTMEGISVIIRNRIINSWKISPTYHYGNYIQFAAVLKIFKTRRFTGNLARR